MDLVDICTVTAAANKKQSARKKNRVWHKRLRRRKRAAQLPTMQRKAQNGPKKLPEKREQRTDWPSSTKPHLEAQQSESCTNHSIDALRFMCIQCKDNLEYVPKDLVRHFEENHRGSSPVFCCHMCPFDAHDFAYLQVHLLSHKDTFSSCIICNDDVKRTWSELSAHLTMRHCQNGKYSCEKCQGFSTGDVTVFLEHMCAHHLGLQRAHEIGLPKDNTQFGSMTASQTLCCPHCSYEASQKWVLAKHINANHGCHKGNQRKKEIHSIATKSNNTQITPRLTRSTVREMCWLTQDCLSLPGRDFLEKYCHLSDPQTTLEKTQQFLMKSVAGEKGDRKWTKALKSVLSNVPQDINVHPKSENGILSNSEDLTVLTVQNKITVAQNAICYAKRLKMVEKMEKESPTPENPAGDAHYDVGQKGCQVILNDDPHYLETETKLRKDSLTSTHNEPLDCVQIIENGENQDLKTNFNIGTDVRPENVQLSLDGISIYGEPVVINESQEQRTTYKDKPKNKTLRRGKRKSRSKKVQNVTSELALKIVLKKNPVKERQWVSQSPLLTVDGLPVEDQYKGPNSDRTVKVSIPVTDQQDPQEANAAAHAPSRAELLPHCSANPARSENVLINQPVVFEDLLLPFERKHNDANKSLQFLETVLDKSILSKTAVEVCPESAQLSSSSVFPDCSLSAIDGATQSSHSKSPPLSQPAITQKGVMNSGGASLTVSTEQSDHCVEGPSGFNPELLNNADPPMENAIQQESWPAFVGGREPAPKSLQRTLKLIAMYPTQLVRRPVRDQPVVVLNHPDADIPEVARIMNVVGRYRGAVQKVILSQRTLNALSTATNRTHETNHYMAAQTQALWHGENLVQERFVLKLRLRRLSRKKYEVVGAVSPNRKVAKKFSCWFCGRVFDKQEVWMVHRQRHLMDWKRPNCENF
ncbi:zinc finger protein 518A-like isoform X1 [Phycodurus eques]|uniref:zinc finger protein 518A-like isoform X1 n=2 Tax=Phycodurus eques TaxID=693459 RepID=UPI002ACEA8B9|nr:zinc finger protein 518A-like isoform X1 [Phycodurus eques]